MNAAVDTDLDMSLLDQFRAIPGARMREVGDKHMPVWEITIPLGEGFAGEYRGGYWGDPIIKNDQLEFVFTYGDIYGDGDILIGEGTVHLRYGNNSGLAYTSKLETKITDRIQAVSNGLITAEGSEQGMQGDDYLSLDVFVEGIE